jgi:hypothetical protein
MRVRALLVSARDRENAELINYFSVRGAAHRADERAFFLPLSLSLSLSLRGLFGDMRGRMRVPEKGKVERGVPRSAAFIYYPRPQL